MAHWLKHALIAALLAASTVVCAADQTPDALLKQTTDDVLAVVRQDRDIQAGDRQKTYALVEAFYHERVQEE